MGERTIGERLTEALKAARLLTWSTVKYPPSMSAEDVMHEELKVAARIIDAEFKAQREAERAKVRELYDWLRGWKFYEDHEGSQQYVRDEIVDQMCEWWPWLAEEQEQKEQKT